MKSTRKWALMFSVLVFTAVLFGNYIFTGQPTQVSTSYIEYSWTSRSNISIGRDSDFTRVGAQSGCECVNYGVGVELAPYVISGWVINASGIDGISIFGTSVYFVIRGVKISGDAIQTGVYLDHVRNGRIEDSVITNNFVGVYVQSSENLAFTNNTILNNQYGIQLEASDNSLVSSNRLHGNEKVSIFVRGFGNILKNNIITKSGFGGINIDGTAGPANNNLIEGNVVTDSVSYGIAMWRATNCVIRGNTVSRNGLGIMLTDQSDNNTIERNIVTDNVGDGILLVEESSDNIVRENKAEGNGDGVNTFDLYDAGSGNIWQNNTYDTKNPDTLS